MIFTGEVIDGIGKHSQLFVPGKDAFEGAPGDWPAILCPGSLNVRTTTYPREFFERGIALSTKSLDIACFLQTFTIAQALMENNKLLPEPAMPIKGTAQVWRARLEANGQTADCWVLGAAPFRLRPVSGH